MEFTASWGELALLVGATLGAGLLAGIMAGLFGVGGGAVLVPILYQIFGLIGVDEAVRMHLSVGTSLAVIVPTSIRSFTAHRKRGAVDEDLLRSWIIPVPLGVIVGSIVAASVGSFGLRAIFAAIATVIGLRMVLLSKPWHIADRIPGNPVRSIVGFFIGLFSTLMGIGGGVLNNTFMTAYGQTLLRAVATSSGVGVLISIPGIFGYIWAGWGAEGLPPLSLGYIQLIGVLLITPVTILVAPIGVRMAHAASKRQLEIGFGIFLLAVAARFAISLFWG